MVFWTLGCLQKSMFLWTRTTTAVSLAMDPDVTPRRPLTMADDILFSLDDVLCLLFRSCRQLSIQYTIAYYSADLQAGQSTAKLGVKRKSQQQRVFELCCTWVHPQSIMYKIGHEIPRPTLRTGDRVTQYERCTNSDNSWGITFQIYFKAAKYVNQTKTDRCFAFLVYIFSSRKRQPL